MPSSGEGTSSRIYGDKEYLQEMLTALALEEAKSTLSANEIQRLTDYAKNSVATTVPATDNEKNSIEVLNKLGADSRQLYGITVPMAELLTGLNGTVETSVISQDLDDKLGGESRAAKWGLDNIHILYSGYKEMARRSPGDGYTLLDVDLNKGCGAKTAYIYLHHSYRQTNNPIVAVAVIEGKNANAPPGWTKIDVDLNKDAGGASFRSPYVCQPINS